MNILKEVILNQLIKVPAVKNMAKKRHRTGLSHCPERIDEYYDILRKYSSVKDKDVLELGPGMTFDIVLRAKNDGAARAVIADIEPYLSEQQLSEYGIEYKIYDGDTLPFPDNSFDYVWSTSVYEHVRKPERVVSETYRILRPGGRVVHLIDLVDHFSYTDDNPYMVFNCLKYSEWTWNAMTRNRSNYVNRLRSSDWIKLHEDKGFNIISSKTKASEFVQSRLKRDPALHYLRNYSESDAISTDIELVAEK